MNQVIFVNLRNRENVLSNLKLAMLKEIVGLGPLYYCVIKSYNLDFESLFMLVLHYLPKEKFCIYPSGGAPLENYRYHVRSRGI